MMATLTNTRDTPVFEALPSETSLEHPAPQQNHFQKVQQIKGSETPLQKRQSQPIVASSIYENNEAGSEGAHLNSATDNRTIVVGMLVQCEECGKKFINSYYLEKHIQKRHGRSVGEPKISGPPTAYISSVPRQTLQPVFDTSAGVLSAPSLALFEQQQQQQLLQQHQILQQQQQLQQQQHLLQQQLSLLSTAAMKASETQVTAPALTQPARTLAPLVGSGSGEDSRNTAGRVTRGNSTATLAPGDRRQTLDEVKLDVQKELHDAFKTLKDTFKDELLELQQQLNNIEPSQHRDTAVMLLNELKDTSQQRTKKKRATAKIPGRPLPSVMGRKHSAQATDSRMLSPSSSSSSDLTESSRSCRSSISYSTRRDSEKHIRSHSIGGGSVDSKTTRRSHTKSRYKDGKSNNRSGREFEANKSPACSTQCKLQGDSGSASRTNGAADLTGEILRSERRTSNLTKDLLVDRPASLSQAVGATGPEAANEMRRAILCLLMYSHREFMARSQLPDVLRHNSKPPPDEVEKHLELPPGTLSCQLANYLLHPAVSGQRSGVTTSNAPQNCDTLNLPWPSTHGGGGCCYHLHKPPPPPRAFSMRAKLQQLKQRLTNKPPAVPVSCPAAQTPASAAAGLVKSQRQKWVSSTAQGSQQAPQASQVATAPARMNGASLLMQHGGQSGGLPLPPLGVQKPPAQQLLPYTIDGGAVTPKARAHPVAVHPSRSSGPDKTNQNRSGAISHSPDMVRVAANKSAANHPITVSQVEPHNAAREKSKSITERDVGAVIPALAWSGEEAIPSEQDLSLPEPKSPFYPPRNHTAGTKVPLVFPPCSSWTPIEPPPTAPSIPLSVLQAALGVNTRLPVTTPNSGNQPPKRQLPVHIQPPPLSGAAVPTKSQRQLMQQGDIVNQQLHQHYFELQHPQGSLQAAPTSDELSAIQLKAPENALGVFDRPAEPAGTHNQAGDCSSAEYLPSARGSRTLPGDAGWNTVNYQPNGDLGPWQFAGLL